MQLNRGNRPEHRRSSTLASPTYDGAKRGVRWGGDCRSTNAAAIP